MAGRERLKHTRGIPRTSIAGLPADLRDLPERDRQQRGRTTRERALAWSQCRWLMSHHIISVGISVAGPGFAFSRVPPSTAVVMACTAGSGVALTADGFREVTPGSVYCMPAGTRQAYAARTTPWRVTWICYLESDQRPSAVPGPPAAHRGDAKGLETLVLALLGEVHGAADPAMLGHYAALVDLHARRLATAVGRDPLRAVWAAVEADLARPWRLGDLARLAGMGVEALRLASLASTRHSPMQHLTHLRMHRAALDLAGGDALVGAIALRVGYDNAFAFSTAFKRCLGMAPAVYRGHRRGHIAVG